MKYGRIFAAFLVTLALLELLMACSPGDLGSEEIAFVRAGGLWTIDPNGSNAFEVASQNTPIIGYGLSPDHQIFVFRALDSDFEKTASGRHLVTDPLTGMVGDVPSSLNTIGVDGGTPIPIILSAPDLTHSNAWWNPVGNRLLYREAIGSSNPTPAQVAWWSSQSDQPVGIARKLLPTSYAIPSLSATLILADSAQGLFTTSLTGTNVTSLQRGALPGHPLPASLERVLWQPGQQHPALLYAIAASPQTARSGTFVLMLHTASGQTRMLTSCGCQQFAWSPDGNQILYRTDQGYTIFNLQKNTSFHFSAELDAVPYWSPDSRELLLDGQHTLTLVTIASQRTQMLLSDGSTPVISGGSLPGQGALLQPVANSLWNIDAQRFIFITRGRTLWQGKKLASGNGLYLVSLNAQGSPTLVDNGVDTQPGWSYQDPNTSFLF